MLKGGREATKWLNNHANVVSPSLLYDSGGRRVSTYGPNDSLEQLKGFWDSIWYRYSNVALDFALQQWQREGRRSQLDSFNIDAQDLWMSARKSSGSSAGPDGWTGNEVAAWPLRAWQVYAKLLARWGLKHGNMWGSRIALPSQLIGQSMSKEWKMKCKPLLNLPSSSGKTLGRGTCWKVAVRPQNGWTIMPMLFRLLSCMTVVGGACLHMVRTIALSNSKVSGTLFGIDSAMSLWTSLCSSGSGRGADPS